MMRARVMAVVLGVLCAATHAIADTAVTDATGRTLQVPATIRKVYAAGPPASVFVLALAPGKLAGWTRALRPDEVPFLPPEVARLPELGRLTGRGNTANVEVVMAARPDLIVDIGSTNATYVSLAERVQGTTGIPYLLFDGRLRDTARLLRDLGNAIGERAAGDALAREFEASLARIDARVAAIPAERRPRVFYARGPNGLATAPRGSLQAEVFEIAGARNVAEPPPGFAANLFTVSIEQVLRWQPDGGEAMRGAVHLPSFPMHELRQSSEWTLPDGRSVWLMLHIDEPLIAPEAAGTFRVPRRHRVVLRQGDARVGIGDA